jgi:uncharacterized membrane protein YgcG
VVETIAAAKSVALGLADPDPWPAEVSQTGSEVESSGDDRGSTVSPGLYWLIALLLGGSLAVTLFGWAVVAIQVRLHRALAAKTKALEHVDGIGALLWFLGAISMIVVANMDDVILVPALSFFSVAIPFTLLHLSVKKRVSGYISSYRLTCDSCGKKMKIIGEQADDSFLEVEEVAEENAGGMDYEFWECPSCSKVTRFAIKLRKASKCPKCKRRTVTRTVSVLKAATESSGGRERIRHVCGNPKCDYRKIYERSTPSLSSSGGSSCGSSGGSFGGGSSGGGGASRGW